MPSSAPRIGAGLAKALRALGLRLRAQRKHLRVSSTATAEAAGMSRQTLFRIEKGEPSVAIGAWLSAAAAVGLELELRDPTRRAPALKLPASVRPADYPQLRKLAWQLKSDVELTPQEALDIYERNWRHVDVGSLTARERTLVEKLLAAFGRERLLV
jgi:transcriptional regulator with XRE-family HTH domain